MQFFPLKKAEALLSPWVLFDHPFGLGFKINNGILSKAIMFTNARNSTSAVYCFFHWRVLLFGEF